MFESFASTNSISFIIVFLEGLLSFFSPCIIPLIPVYMSYLAGNTNDIGKDGKITFDKKKVFLHTVCFIFGISVAFFILGMSFTAIGSFFKSYKIIFTRIAGIIIVILGLFQLGIFDIKFLNNEKKFHFNLNGRKINPLVAFIMGFTFSFAWTPCVGPALSSVLILASTSSSSLLGNALVLVYTLGFVIPFLLLGLFTTQVLNFLHNHIKLLKYMIKVGGVILIIMGIMLYTGWMNGISGYLNSFGSTNVLEQNNKQAEVREKNSAPSSVNSNTSSKEEKANSEITAFDFTLVDQYGNTHTLSDYKGKVVFLNFWATWCPPCQKEMPDIETLYNEYNQNKDDVIFLGVANPKSENNMNTREVEKEGVIEFLEANKFTFPVLFDETGDVYMQYNISALPTTYMIDKKGNIKGYAPGMLTKDIMKNIIDQTLNSTN